MGAQCDLLPKFNHHVVWSKLLNVDATEPNVNFFVGVPTIFTQLVNSDYLKRTEFADKRRICDILQKKMRVIASGSAPLIVKTFNDWYDLTKFSIVERYGMTEIGGALTNPYIETDTFKREAGLVGRPFGEIKARLVHEDKVVVESSATSDLIMGEDLFGELQISGPNVFKEYLNKPEQTYECFTADGWFKTGI